MLNSWDDDITVNVGPLDEELAQEATITVGLSDGTTKVVYAWGPDEEGPQVSWDGLNLVVDDALAYAAAIRKAAEVAATLSGPAGGES